MQFQFWLKTKHTWYLKSICTIPWYCTVWKAPFTSEIKDDWKMFSWLKKTYHYASLLSIKGYMQWRYRIRTWHHAWSMSWTFSATQTISSALDSNSRHWHIEIAKNDLDNTLIIPLPELYCFMYMCTLILKLKNLEIFTNCIDKLVHVIQPQPSTFQQQRLTPYTYLNTP